MIQSHLNTARCPLDCIIKKVGNHPVQGTHKTINDVGLGLHGIGPSGAARLLVEAGDITRFPTKGHFASWTGTAPIDASSGGNVRRRLSRGGSRQINRALHMMAVLQLRNAPAGRAYYDRKVAAGKTPNEAMRCLIGGLSVSRPGLALTVARRSRREMASLPSRSDGQF
jgi:transposase